MIQDVLETQSFLWLSSSQLLEKILKVGRRDDALEDAPERLAILGAESFEVRVFEVGLSERGTPHHHYEESGCCRENVCFEGIVKGMLRVFLIR